MNTKNQEIVEIEGFALDAPGQLEAALLEAERRLGLYISINDRAALFLTETGEPVFPGARLRHERPYCEWGRDRYAYDQACLSHCSVAMNHEAARRGSPFVHRCWKGAAEIVVPVMHEGAHVCTLFAGVWKSSAEVYGPAAENMPPLLANMRAALPDESPEAMRTLVGPLQLLGIGLVNLWLPMMRLSGVADRLNSIRRFLHLRVTNDIRLADLAAYLHLSESRTGALVREHLGCSFQEAVMNERLRRAQYLLAYSPHPVKIIAGRVGFKSEYYFSRVFTKHIGMPPGKWRHQQV